MLRLATAAILVPLLWALIKLASPPWFLGVAALAISAACLECYRMLERTGARPFKSLGLAAVLALVWTFGELAPRFEALLPLALAGLATVAAAMWSRASPGDMLLASWSTLFPVWFVALSLGHLVRLRAVPGTDGSDLVLLVFLCVIFADTAAYYWGSRFGRRRLAPQLSPKKSWEGMLAGLAASVLGALVAHVWFYQRLSVAHALVLGVILGGVGVLGDLAESMLKRAAGVKDSSGLIPGHGGLLDRTDSLLFAGPVVYYYYRWFM